MNQMIVLKESFPTRCEICHQRDLFVPETAHCQRCAGYNESISPGRAINRHEDHSRNFTSYQLWRMRRERKDFLWIAFLIVTFFCIIQFFNGDTFQEVVALYLSGTLFLVPVQEMMILNEKRKMTKISFFDILGPFFVFIGWIVLHILIVCVRFLI